MSIQLSAMDASLAALGSPRYLGTINAGTTAKTNAEASTPFAATGDALKGKMLLIVTDAAVRLHGVATSDGDVTTTRNAAGFGVPLAADERVVIRVVDDYPYLSVITASGSANVDIWELT